jgi:hypothetical protein
MKTKIQIEESHMKAKTTSQTEQREAHGSSVRSVINGQQKLAKHIAKQIGGTPDRRRRIVTQIMAAVQTFGGRITTFSPAQ